MSTVAPSIPPKAFISYSWDNAEHMDWVLQLATRLRHDGVDVVLDRWDTSLGSDLSLFMEQSADIEFRVVAIASDTYTSKADNAEGGVGYERRVITPTLMANLAGHRIIPVLRSNPFAALPRFLGAAKYVDMRAPERYEDAYFELLQDLHGMEATPKPPLGRNPFLLHPDSEVRSAVSWSKGRYVSPGLSGTVQFDHSNDDGQYVIGAGDRSFTLAFSVSGPDSVVIYHDPADIRTVALARDATEPSHIGDASQYDGSSRARVIKTGDAAVVSNVNGYWAAVFVDEIEVRETSLTGEPRITFRYFIPETCTPEFRPGT
ncbi:toll/interleukin-1 receptor domain-containing protein [Nocardioides alcanivorans]|uniref:toll/interleukin-1 receptor domain-containing protein n=1 Tax=Nocardioides alcanivorans TaxID=2897352 RepID=UPI001F1A9776|nr:toll/interleukin-1 receptor domain-containing protein [Nocardioides alcanivorans]